ncbi:DUF2169 domain-containing protein [Lysobacter firmicutimachus]|uniref:DUF2169 domain-containing protein n=1 Tax=Lysobacter firmicutimachus TaxID=1792846 RepID=A0AAU8MRV8_9GAMM
MRTTKPTHLSYLTRCFRDRGSEHLGLAVAALVNLGPKPTLGSDQDLWRLVGEEVSPMPLDEAVPKGCPEYLVSGYAYPEPGQASAERGRVRVRIAGKEKQLQVHGDRCWLNAFETSDPAPYDRMRLDWKHAYGGPGYDANPDGIGASGTATGQTGLRRVPNVEYADYAQGRAGAETAPASFAPLPPAWPQRSALYGRTDDHWLKHDYPGLPRDHDRRYYNLAPADQQLAGCSAFPSAAEYEILGMHPERARLHGRLPALRARAFVLRRGSDELEETALRLTTAWFFPHREQAILIYHGQVQVQAFDASDLFGLLLAGEQEGQERPRSWYRQVLQWRNDPTHGALYCLRDRDLLPVEWLPDAAETGTRSVAPRLQRELDRAKRRLHEVPPPGHGVDALPDPELKVPALPAVDALPEFVQQTQRRSERELAEIRKISADALAEEHIERARSAASPHGKSVAAPPAPHGPPKLARPDLSVTTVHAPRGCDAAALERHLQRCERDLLVGYRLSAQHQAPAPRLDAAAAEALRERVAAAHARGDALAAIDLTGADLRGLNLRGARLEGALLEGADLSDADLSSACLDEAVFVRCNLTRTRLSAAVGRRSNFAQAICEETDFSRCELDEANFEGVRLHRCTFSSATVQRGRFDRAMLDRIDFGSAQLGQLMLIGNTLNDIDLRRAKLRKIVFSQCRLRDIDLSDSDIENLALLDTQVQGDIRLLRARVCKAALGGAVLPRIDFSHACLTEVNFRDARLRGARFASAQVRASDLTDADLSDANLSRVKIRDGLMVRTTLRGADLSSSDLIGAYLRGACLEGANLESANLFRAHLSEVSLDQSTRLHGAYLEKSIAYPARERSP